MIAGVVNKQFTVLIHNFNNFVQYYPVENHRCYDMVIFESVLELSTHASFLYPLRLLERGDARGVSCVINTTICERSPMLMTLM